jgi:hypothetical protein
MNRLLEKDSLNWKEDYEKVYKKIYGSAKQFCWIP